MHFALHLIVCFRCDNWYTHMIKEEIVLRGEESTKSWGSTYEYLIFVVVWYLVFRSLNWNLREKALIDIICGRWDLRSTIRERQFIWVYEDWWKVCSPALDTGCEAIRRREMINLWEILRLFQRLRLLLYMF